MQALTAADKPAIPIHLPVETPQELRKLEMPAQFSCVHKPISMSE